MSASAITRRPIRRLDDRTVLRIAAGEVVERPASVVKELVENALDAGAGEVLVRLAGGGLELIEVEDDGSGIPAEELTMALERHATSKLAGPEDLSEVTTLGFRGEALASIAAVSKLRLFSRPPGTDEAHGLLVIGGGSPEGFVTGRAPGTSVEVRELFFNTPARRKFLRAPAAEQVEVLQTIERLYLARPLVGLTLLSEDREVARFPPSAKLSDAAGHALGPEFLEQSFALKAEGEHGLRLRGILGRPTISRASSTGLYLSLNGRVIVSRGLSRAVALAFADHLPKGRFPVGVIHFEVAPSRVDVNVHPTKREVRIARERDLEDLLRGAVRAALLAAPAVSEPLTAVSGVAAPPAIRTLDDLSPEPMTGPVSVALPRVGSSVRPLSPLAHRREVRGNERHPRLYLLGCIANLYWLAESDDGLVIVDQHAASERLQFDRLRAQGALPRQELVSPVRLELTAPQAEALRSRGDEVRSGGFDVEPFGGDSYRVHSVPVYHGRLAPVAQLLELLDELAGGTRPTVPDDPADRVRASIACHGSVRAGD
ncbi:MAG: DNA mismatch repair endonuclease MutL, partial [Thermoplasmata archaeon]|nr:DNA mismatch repair endonuclease MutL [Thermoplasmata archaeon]